MAREVYIALLHYPMLDREGRVITTAVTNLDLHDLARLARTYDLAAYYVVQPLTLQRRLVERLRAYWMEGGGREYNPTRTDAFERVRLVLDLAEAIQEISAETGRRPRIVGTTARAQPGAVSAAQVRKEMDGSGPWLILFGTGWGIDPAFLTENSDYVLRPIRGRSEYNHLSVRAAAAIVLDRLLGDED